jgi:hypothetical protein
MPVFNPATGFQGFGTESFLLKNFTFIDLYVIFLTFQTPQLISSHDRILDVDKKRSPIQDYAVDNQHSVLFFYWMIY